MIGGFLAFGRIALGFFFVGGLGAPVGGDVAPEAPTPTGAPFKLLSLTPSRRRLLVLR